MNTYNKRKILFFLPSSVGGAERMTITIAKMLPRNLFNVKFVIVHKSMGDIINFIPKEYGIIHIPIHNIYCFATLRIMRVICKEKPDVVFCSLMYLNTRIIIASKIYGVKVIIRNNNLLSRNSFLLSNLVKLTYRWADRIIAQQEEMKDELIKLPHVDKGKVVVMHNPLDYSVINEKSTVPSPYPCEDQLKYLSVGRFHYVKGQDVLVKAFKLVQAHNHIAHLYIVGKFDWNNSFDKSVKAFVEDNNLTNCIHFIGFDENPYRWVKYCDCYVMPSRIEGLPNALIEAMYLERPVVATKCIPVIERIVENGCNGYLVPPENPQIMAEAMIKAIDLKNIKFHYCPASNKDFEKLFY